MDEDLKIVLTSELEADEQASARRISAQLPNIAKLINSSSSIKIGVELATPNTQAMQSQVQKISNQISKAANVDVGVQFRVTKDAKQMLRNALNGAGIDGVDSKIVSAMTKDLDDMQVKVKNISAEWVKIDKTKERLLQLSIKGTTKDQQDITVLQQYDISGKKVIETTKNLSLNLEKIEAQERASAERARKDNESRISYLNQQQILLDKLNKKYTDPNAAKPIVYDQDLDQINAEYNKIRSSIEALGSTQGKVSAQMKDNLASQIAEFEQLAKQLQNSEYVATSLRTKTGVEVNAEQVNKLSEYENKLRASGKLTDAFNNKISSLKEQLSTAFDSEKITDYLNQFDRLKSEVGSFDSQIAAINNGFKRLSEAKNAVYATRGKMVGIDVDSSEYEKLNQLLSSQVAHQKEISAELGKQIAKNPALLQYAREYKEYLYASAAAAANLAIQEGRVHDAANSITVSMESIPAVVQNIEARFKSLSNAPEELAQKVKSLQKLMDAVSDAEDDSNKVAAYQKLKEAISGCNREITQLIGVQNSDLRNFRFTEGFEKAKADLATVERQWSALKSDPGLNQQLRILKQHLNDVQEPVALKKWTAEFGRFKSEVKAAGKNVQSFKDMLKNNISKVAQWGLATVSIYDVVNRLKTAATTVVELDTAMIDLRKTTDETDAAYKRFYLSANSTAKQLGVTTTEVIAQTAEWSRLGYSMAEAAKMAEDSAIFAAISPELNTEEATDGLISIMKAFGYEADEVLDGVISKINKVGKRIAQQYSNVLEESSYIG